MNMLALWLTVATASMVAAGAWAAPVAAERHVGTVLKAETSPPALLMQLDGGGEKWMAVPSDTDVLRVAPGEKDLAKAAKLKFDEVRAGDRVLVRAEGEPAVARQIVVLSQGDLERQRQAERDDWRKRGVSGRVSAVNPETGEVSILTAARFGSAVVVVKLGARTEQRRYGTDSARFSDARASTISDIHVGDQIQALGARTPDGRSMSAEKIISGSFRNFTATVAVVNPARQEMTVELVGNGPPMMVKIAPGSILRKLSPQATTQLAGTNAPKTGVPGTQNILDDSLTLTVAEFQRGDAVVIATGNGAPAGAGAPIAAFAVIAGVEPLLKRSAEAQRELLGSWNLSLDPETSGGRGGQR
jgi:hypothetical protein